MERNAQGAGKEKRPIDKITRGVRHGKTICERYDNRK